MGMNDANSLTYKKQKCKGKSTGSKHPPMKEIRRTVVQIEADGFNVQVVE